MKVAKWKVLGLAGALALGYAVSSEAAQIKVDDKTWANFGLNMKIWYKNLDKRSNSTTDTNYSGWSKNVFSVGNTKIYFTGQVTPLFQFYGEFDQEKSTPLGEAAINMAFAKEFQVLAGLIRKPFTRAQLASGYAYLTPQGYWLDPQDKLGALGLKDALKSTDYGLMFHGDLAGGMFRYRLGVFNENRETGNKKWSSSGWTSITPTSTIKHNDKKNFEWNARIEFTPTMLGFKPESAATITSKINDTYLGQKDVLTIGLGYHTETHTPKYNATLGDLKRKGWTIDALFEKKFGTLVPNLQIGYINLDDTHYYQAFRLSGSTWVSDKVKKGDANIWYIQGQLLFDQVVGLGKPALAFRYENIKGDGEWTNGTTRKKDLEASTFGLAFNYYLKGQSARISLGFDHKKYDEALKGSLKYGSTSTKYEDSITDWYLYLQSQF